MFLSEKFVGKKFTWKNDPTSPKVEWMYVGYAQHPDGPLFVLGITFDSVNNRTRTGQFKWSEVEFVGDIAG